MRKKQYIYPTVEVELVKTSEMMTVTSPSEKPQEPAPGQRGLIYN